MSGFYKSLVGPDLPVTTPAKARETILRTEAVCEDTDRGSGTKEKEKAKSQPFAFNLYPFTSY